MTKKPSPKAPILLGKPMLTYASYPNAAGWYLRIDEFFEVMVMLNCPGKKTAAAAQWKIMGLQRYGTYQSTGTADPQRAADAAGKVLEQLAKAIRGER